MKENKELLRNIERSLLWNTIFNNLCLIEWDNGEKDGYDRFSLSTKIEEDIILAKIKLTDSIDKDWINFPHKQSEIEFPE